MISHHPLAPFVCSTARRATAERNPAALPVKVRSSLATPQHRQGTCVMTGGDCGVHVSRKKAAVWPSRWPRTSRGPLLGCPHTCWQLTATCNSMSAPAVPQALRLLRASPTLAIYRRLPLRRHAVTQFVQPGRGA